MASEWPTTGAKTSAGQAFPVKLLSGAGFTAAILPTTWKWKSALGGLVAATATSSRARPPDTGVRILPQQDWLRYPQFPGEKVRDTFCEACESPPSALPLTCSSREPAPRT